MLSFSRRSSYSTARRHRMAAYPENFIESLISMSEDKSISTQFINREISLLEFQRRVLEEAQDECNPLLERVKLLSIFGSNMDEFFMVRVSGIRKQVEHHIMEISPDDLTPPAILAAARKLSLELYEQALHHFNKKSGPILIKPAFIFWNTTNSARRRRKRWMIILGK